MQQISYTSSSKSNFLRNVKRLAAVCATLGLIAGGIYVHSRMVRRDDVTHDKSSFFNDRDYDVLFFGTSHMRAGIIPFQLWKDYGITSYNLAVNSMQIDTAYYAIKEACSYHKPKIAVLDVYSCRLNYPDVDEETAVSRFQLLSDNFIISKNKVCAVKSFFSNRDVQKQLLFPYTLYHNRWNETSFRFSHAWNELGFHEINAGCGFGPYLRLARNISEYELMRRICEDEYLNNEDSDGILYVKKFISFCKENGILPVLVYLPVASGVLQQKEGNTMQRIATELNVPYYNMLPYESNLIDYHVDLRDCNVGKEDSDKDTMTNGNIHLNLSGAIKVTDYIGKILRNDFNLANHRGESGYEAWNDDYKTFRKYILVEISKQSELDVLLMSCMFEGLSVQLDVAEGIAFDDVEQRLIAQLGKRISVVPSTRKELECDVHITITDDETHDTVTEKSFNTGYSTFRAK